MLLYESIKRIHIEVSSVCNAACPNCPRNVHGGYTLPNLIEKVICFDDFKTIIDITTIKHLEQIRFCGNYGDPATCPDLPKMIDWLFQNNPKIRVEINTNGGIRNSDWWANLGNIMRNRFGSFIIFSIDGLEDTNHIYRRGVDWTRLEENFKAYINAGGMAIWEFLVFHHNEHQIDQARLLSCKLGFNNFRIKHPFGFNDSFNSSPYMLVLNRQGEFEGTIWPKGAIPSLIDKKTMDLESYNIEVDRAYKAALVDEDEIRQYIDYMDKNRPAGIDCMSIRDKEIYIDSQGNLYPCCFLGHSSQIQRGRETITFQNWITENIGWKNINLFNKSISEIMNSEYFTRISDTWKTEHSEGKISMCSLMCSSDCSKNKIRNLYD